MRRARDRRYQLATSRKCHSLLFCCDHEIAGRHLAWSQRNWPPPAATESSLMPAVQVAPQRGHSLDEGPSALNPSDRAFWIGLSLVLLSLVSAFATYLILTGLTPITPRNEVVLTRAVRSTSCSSSR